MSDGEDDFMCEEEEDYGLVSICILRKEMLMYEEAFKRLVRILILTYMKFKNSFRDILQCCSNSKQSYLDVC